MSSPAWVTQEVQASTPNIAPQIQIQDSPVGGPPTRQPTSLTASSTSGPPVGGSSTGLVTPVTSPPTPVSGPSTAVAGPSTPADAPPAPRPPHVTVNEPLQDPVRAKFVTSPGYVVPAPSFSYSVFPRANSASGSPQQSSSTPVVRLTPPVSAAALQPPVPGQSVGNRPSFSYSIVSPGVSSATGQQFQPTTGTSEANLQGGKFTPATAASLQPPVPGQSVRPNSSVPGTITQNFAPPVQFPFSIPKGQVSTSTFSFRGSSQPSTIEASEKDVSSNSRTSDAVAPEAGTASSAMVGSQSIQFPAKMPSSSSMTSAMSPNMNSSRMLMPTAPSFPQHPGILGTAGTQRPPGMPNSASFSSSVTIQQTGNDSSPSSLRPMVPSPASAPPSTVSMTIPVQQTVQQHIFSPYPSLPAMASAPQSLWLHPSQSGGFPRPTFLQYPGVLSAPFPLPIRVMPLPHVPLPNVQPPGVSTMVSPEGTSSATTGSGQPGSNTGAPSPPPGIDHDKPANNDLHVDGGITKNEVDAWTAHKTETGAIYYYNSLTGESTYEKPSSFKGEAEKVTVQSTPLSWEKLPGTSWTLVTTNDGKKYYYDTKNKVSSWQIPTEVAELRKNQDIETLKVNATQVQNASIIADKGSSPISLSAPAVQTGGRDSFSLRNSGPLVSSSALDLIKKKLQDSGTPITSAPLPTSSGPTTSDVNGSRAVEATVKGQQHSVNSKDKIKDANADDNMSDSSSASDDVDSGPTKEECITQFKEMLKERGVAPFSKWDKELPKIVFDPRFKAVPGYSLRRSLFEHYVRTRAEEERKEKRAAQKAVVDGFKQLLEEASEDIDHKTDYQTFKRKWGSDPRFEGLDRKERELLLNEKILPLKKAAEEKLQAIRTVAVSSFKSLLREKGDITTSSRWSRVKDSLRNDPRYKTVKHEEREVLFNEYISELKAGEDEAERAAKAKKEEQEKLKERERETRKRKEREEQEMERVRLKVRRKEAVASYQALLVETIKDPKASWTECKPKLEKDPQGRAETPELSQADLEKIFRDHVKDLYERCAREYCTLLAEVITAEAAVQITDDGKTLLNSWSEAKGRLKPDPRYTKMPRKERESLWSRYAEDMIRKQKSASDPKENLDTDRKKRTSYDFARRSPRRSHGRR